jgi:hypothetical protein
MENNRTRRYKFRNKEKKRKAKFPEFDDSGGGSTVTYFVEIIRQFTVGSEKIKTVKDIWWCLCRDSNQTPPP